MIPGSYDFLVFVCVATIGVYLSLKLGKTRGLILLFINLGYLFSFGVWNFLSVIGLSVITYISKIGGQKFGKFFIGLGVVVNVSTLILMNISNEIESPIQYLIPIGLSFIVFKNISYLIDKESFGNGIIKYLTYITFFPSLTSGPIHKYKEFEPSENSINGKIVYESIIRIIVGLFKKLVIATYLSENLVLSNFQISEGTNPIILLIALYGFAIQLYADFGGYSDIAIGTARLLGYKLDENFTNPYNATSIREFWGKWHISLSEWLKTYVYFPLGGSRYGKIREILNTITVMLLSALWHGASLNFLIWGGIHAFSLILEKLVNFNFVSNWIRKFAVFHIVCFSWIFFNIKEFDEAILFIKNLTDYTKLFEYDLNVNIWSIVLIIIGFWLQNNSVDLINSITTRTYRLKTIFKGIFVGILILFIFWLGPDTVPNFIYYNF